MKFTETLVVAALAFTLVSESAGREVRFAPVEEGADRVAAQSLDLKDGRLVSVAVVGADPARATLASGEELRLLAHDPVTRLTLLQRASDVAQGGTPPLLGNALELQGGDALRLPGQAPLASRLVKWENSYAGKILPVALLRIHHPPGKKPLPGTPLFDEKGRVLAMCHQAAPQFGNGTFALPVEAIERLVEDFETLGEVRACWIGVTVNAINPVLVVEMVRPGSPAAKSGVEKGDILLSVGPRRVTNYAEARDAFYYMLAGRATPLDLLRGTEVLKLNVIPEIHPAATRSQQ